MGVSASAETENLKLIRRLVRPQEMEDEVGCQGFAAPLYKKGSLARSAMLSHGSTVSEVTSRKLCRLVIRGRSRGRGLFDHAPFFIFAL